MTKRNTPDYPFDISRAKRAFNVCYQTIGADLASARAEDEDSPAFISRESLFEVCLDQRGFNFHPDDDLAAWLDSVKFSEMMKLAPHVFPYEVYE